MIEGLRAIGLKCFEAFLNPVNTSVRIKPCVGAKCDAVNSRTLDDEHRIPLTRIRGMVSVNVNRSEAVAANGAHHFELDFVVNVAPLDLEVLFGSALLCPGITCTEEVCINSEFRWGCVVLRSGCAGNEK